MARSNLVITEPAAEPLSLAEAKLHLKGPESADDDLVTALIKAARLYVEGYLHRALITQTRELKLDCFPQVIELEYAPVSSLTSVKYTDSAGAEQTVAPGDIDSDLASAPARLQPAYGCSWPTPRPGFNAVRVRYVCGYGATGNTVPENIRVAMKHLIAHLYENRSAVEVGTIATEVPFGVKALLNPYVIHGS